MDRLFSRIATSEALLLSFLSAVVCFVITYTFVSFELLTVLPEDRIRVPLVNGVGIMVAVTGLVALAVGMSQPPADFRRRRLAQKTLAGGLAALVLIICLAPAAVDIRSLLDLDVLFPVKLVLVWGASLALSHVLLRVAVRAQVFVRPIAVIGGAHLAERTAEAVRLLPPGLFTVTAVITGAPPAPAGWDTADPGPPGDVIQAVRTLLEGPRPPLTVVVTSDLDSHTGQEIARRCAAAGVAVERDVDFWEHQLRRVDIAQVTDGWVAAVAEATPRRMSAAVARAADIMFGLMLLAGTLPLMAFTTIAIRLEGPGPILYRQQRVGLRGRPFTLFKFRSMRPDAEALGPAWAARRDPRVTRVGAVIRRTRIDELPQLLNVLRGEMSLVGPRPERPHFVATLAREIPFYHVRHMVKPGLTGWAQVNFSYGASVEDARVKLSFDLYQVRHHSLLLYLVTLFLTVRVIVFQEGSR